MKRLFGWLLAAFLLVGVYGCGGDTGTDAMPADDDVTTDDSKADDGKTDDSTTDGGETPPVVPPADGGAPPPVVPPPVVPPPVVPPADGGEKPAPVPPADGGDKPAPAPGEGASTESGRSVLGAVGRAFLKGAAADADETEKR
jgi:predicted small lipoprotein YifL